MTTEGCTNVVTDPSLQSVADTLKCFLDKDLLEPQFYPDPVVFRASLEKLNKDDIELKKTLTSNKATLRVLAPYLKTIYTDQKRIIETARIQRATKTKDVKLIYDKKSMDVFRAIPDVMEKFEVIIAIHETADVLKALIKANNVVSYMVNSEKAELYQNPRHIVSSTSKLTSKIEQGTTIAAYSAFTKDYVMSDSVFADGRFPLGLGYETSIIKYAMCVPIKTPDDKLIAVYELTRDAHDSAFTKKDLQIVLAVTTWMGVSITQNELYNSLMSEQDLTNHLLHITDLYHCEYADVDKTLSDVAMLAREVVGAERCNLYVVDKESKGALIVEEYDQGPDNQELFKRRTKKTVESDGSVLSKVLFNKQTVKTHQPNLEVVPEGELVVRSLLCVPIICDKTVIGAIQMINKRTEIEFDMKDEEMLEKFSTFCAININHSKTHNRLYKSELQNKVKLEMALYHLKPCVHEQEAMNTSRNNVTGPDQFFTFGWSPRPENLPKVAELTMCLFQEVFGNKFMKSYNVPKFILTVQKCYRPNPYHNFLHAFYATHTMANILIRNQSFFSEIERRALMVAALCHDVDHPGSSNIFIRMKKHHLSELYSSSPLENHHFAVASLIIDQSNLFKNLKSDVYDVLLQEIYNNIIATDVTLYFQSMNELRQSVEKGTFTFQDPSSRRLVMNFIMLACSLSDQTKPLPLGKKIADRIHEELFRLGDVESLTGNELLPCMDRDEIDMIPEERIQFFSVVVLPCVQVVSNIFSAFVAIEENVKVLLEQWKELVLTKDQDMWKPQESYKS
uniref:Phosphodiesterase n=1 Tax=Cuerna arida TaxID=1464854 RepID=A0A1B6GPX3_9HEMI